MISISAQPLWFATQMIDEDHKVVYLVDGAEIFGRVVIVQKICGIDPRAKSESAWTKRVMRAMPAHSVVRW
jgi:hypothetical protein